ncbi:zinc metallochaperone AztD [Cellulomonas sp. GbtcB1]|uniref:zinc metallochaperone AztD n=1 Tax=Cellulomonas sp. GbtcB1 TaxID=2824746 RepID=UPI001C2FB62C|nr:zinc metallochaperone AztD [Cellulomonas sp. GbtcB1]
MTLSTRTRPRLAGALGLGVAAALLAACGSGDAAAEPSATAEETAAPAATEVATAKPRLALTYDGGIQVLDADTLEVVSDIELAGFNRLNPAGDERHVLVSTTGGFQVLDAGTWTEPHGDHTHSFASDPVLTDVLWSAEKPGHAVRHEGRTALFDDGTGQVTVVDSDALADPDAATREYTTPSAHHGVAVELTDGTLVVSDGTEDERTGVRVLDAENTEIAAIDTCPGVHGEAVAADEAVVIGCEDGAVVWAGGALTKVTAPDAYGRIGNQAGSEASPYVLGDYKSDPDADLERPTRVSLIDTRDASIRLVDLPASYTFRSLARGDAGEALVLGTDGALHVIDPESGTVVRSVPVIDAWEEPEEWQQPRPAITVLDGSAYITDPATNSVHAVDVETGEVWLSAELEVTPNEIAGVSGAVAEHGAHEDGHEDHAHEDEHDHAHDEETAQG